MRMLLLLTMALTALCTTTARADAVTISDGNSQLTYTTDNAGSNLGQPSDPVQLPRKVEWTVDGRRILVYPSGPSTFLDIGHLHAGAHVDANQIHAQGPMLGHGTGGPMAGNVLGGVVYTVKGGSAGRSTITEKLDIHNRTGSALSLSLAGFGFKPTQPALEVPDHTGLNLVGTTLVFYQGNAQTNSFTESPFGPVTILPVVSFKGFNPMLNQSLSLPAGARMTMITELKVGPPLIQKIPRPFKKSP
jgi:hypothetical protein